VTVRALVDVIASAFANVPWTSVAPRVAAQ
jgi:hypothetical protein